MSDWSRNRTDRFRRALKHAVAAANPDETGTQPQTCAACRAATLEVTPACWVCVEKAQRFDAQLDDAALGHADTARIQAIKRRGNTYVGALFIAHPEMDPREVLDLIIGTEEDA